MNKYKIIYRRSNGYEGIVVIDAANRTMALEIFKTFAYFKDVIAVDCFRVIDKM